MHQGHFSTKMQKFLIILRIYNSYCSNLPFNVTILDYFNLFLSISLFLFVLFFISFLLNCIDSSIFLKTDAAILYT